jgi:hypothetical protein
MFGFLHIIVCSSSLADEPSKSKEPEAQNH